MQEGPDEAYRMHGSLEPIHQPARRQRPALLQTSQEARIFDPIEKYGSKWIEELPRVVWGLRTQRSQATSYSPFFMVYGSEAILPMDIAFGAPHTLNYVEGECRIAYPASPPGVCPAVDL